MKTTIQTFSGAIFDLDGTLFDSLGAWTEIDRAFFAKRGIPFPPDYAEAVKQLYLIEAAHYTIERFSLKESPEDLVSEWKCMTAEFYRNEVALKPFAKEYLAALKNRGVKMALATSSTRELFLPALERHGISGCFSAIVTAEEVGVGKNFPDVYLEAARQLSLPPEKCAVFEDILSAVNCAHDAGFFTVAVHDERSREQAQLRKAADCYIRSFKELL